MVPPPLSRSRRGACPVRWRDSDNRWNARIGPELVEEAETAISPRWGQCQRFVPAQGQGLDLRFQRRALASEDRAGRPAARRRSLPLQRPALAGDGHFIGRRARYSGLRLSDSGRLIPIARPAAAGPANAI